MMNRVLLWLSLWLLSAPAWQIAAQCDPDTQPPVAACNAGLVIEIATGQTDTLFAGEINAFSQDNCTPASQLQLRIERQPFSASPPATDFLVIDESDVGSLLISLWVTDQAGNSNLCWTEIDVRSTECADPDALPVCIDQLILDLPPSGTITIGPSDILETDHICPQQFVLQINPPSTPLFQLTLGPDDLGNHIVQVTNVNTNISCWANLTLTSNTGNCDGDTTQPTAVCDATPSIVLNESGAGVLYAEQINEGSFDDCTPADNLLLAIEWGPNISASMPTTNQLELTAPGHYIVVLWVADQAGNTNACFSELTVYAPFCGDADPDTYQVLTGRVFQDITENCALDSAEPGLSAWRVKAYSAAIGHTYTAVTNEQGFYEIRGICPGETALDLSLDVPFLYAADCAATWNVNLLAGTPATQNIPVQLDQECPLLTADIVAPVMRRCLPNTYSVSYCNYSSHTIEGVHIEITLDEWMQLTDSEIPVQAIGNNTFFFPIGSLLPGQCGDFNIYFDLSCDAAPGQTHCASARIFPHTLCPESPDWSGANIEVEGFCQNDSVYWRIKNTGSGGMNEPMEFIVVEDVIMYLRDQFQLGSGQTLNLPAIPSNGQTWRLEAPQPNAHPYSGTVAAVVEGCNGINSTGLVRIFPLENPDPSIASDCRENTAAYDPNDKSASVIGLDEERFIRSGTDLEYLIRFQNTGTDTAFRVVILDTLSQWLRPESVRPGATGHPYSFELLEGGILRFSFDNIMLPDSNVNEPASHGFIQFWVRQQADTPPGTRIENTAAIYFDQQTPVITNTVFHTIGDHLIQAASNDEEAQETWGALTVFPNPSAGDADFLLPASLSDANVFFELYDVWSRPVQQGSFQNGRYGFRKGDLSSGVYFYRIKTAGRVAYSGKIVIK